MRLMVLRRAGSFSLAVILELAWTPAPALAADTVTFRVTDQLALGQQEETIAVTINHLPVGTLHVTEGKPEASLTVTVPRAERYVYGLCGGLTLSDETPDFAPHKINQSGEFTEVEGHSYAAFNAFTKVFYLMDINPGHRQEPTNIRDGGACAEAIS